MTQTPTLTAALRQHWLETGEWQALWDHLTELGCPWLAEHAKGCCHSDDRHSCVLNDIFHLNIHSLGWKDDERRVYLAALGEQP